MHTHISAMKVWKSIALWSGTGRNNIDLVCTLLGWVGVVSLTDSDYGVPLRHNSNGVLQHAAAQRDDGRDSRHVLHPLLHAAHAAARRVGRLLVQLHLAEGDDGHQRRATLQGQLDEAAPVLQHYTVLPRVTVERLGGAAHQQRRAPADALLPVQQEGDALCAHRAHAKPGEQLAKEGHHEVAAEGQHVRAHAGEHVAEAERLGGEAAEGAGAEHAVREHAQQVVSVRVQLVRLHQFHGEVVPEVLPPAPVSDPRPATIAKFVI